MNPLPHTLTRSAQPLYMLTKANIQLQDPHIHKDGICYRDVYPDDPDY